MIWFTSDTHFFHNNICKGSTVWRDSNGNVPSACRPFSNAREMNDVFVRNINSVVMPDDTLYFNGDWVLGAGSKLRACIEIRQQINCKNIILAALGNHDYGFGKPYPECHLMMEEMLYTVFSEVHETLERHIEKQRIIFSHFAMRTWNKQGHLSWNLYGHSHGNLPDDKNLLSMDIGIDCNPKGYYPFSLDEVRKFISNKSFVKLDHH